MTKPRLRRGFGVLAMGALALGSLVAVTSPSEAAVEDASSVGGRPGPDILYWDPPRAPQLENTGAWKADPILVSGTSAYRAGEFLYQDFLYDDSGTYPDEPERYAGNAADFVEIRVKPLADATAIRITYNSMLDPELVGTTIGLGGSQEALPMPHGARAVMPAQVFVTVHGATADAVDALSGQVLGQPPAMVDLKRRQVEVRVPYSIIDPRGREAVRVGAATGVWDVNEGGYSKSGEDVAFYNVAFRYNQPLSHWVTEAQDAALAAGDLSEFFAVVDFTKLAAGVTDDSAVPTTGYMNRIKASHFETVQGRGIDSVGGTVRALGQFYCDDTREGCTYEYAGQLQPYWLYVPPVTLPPDGYGLVLDMHGANGDHNGDTSETVNDLCRSVVCPSLAAAFGGSILIRPLARGPSYFYWGQAGADVWETIADVMRHYPIDAERVVASGQSMGGCGSYKIAVQFPDFFAGIYPNVGCVASEAWVTAPGPALGGTASETVRMLASLRHVPVMANNAIADPLVPVTQKLYSQVELERLGYRFDYWYFCDENDGGCSHSEYRGYTVDEFALWASRLAPPPSDPPRVTYALNSVMDEARYGMNSDHAYWLSGLTVRDTANPPPAGQIGVIDVISHGFGVGSAPANVTNLSAGTGPGTRTGAYQRHTKTWGDVPTMALADRLDITATNVATVTIDPVRARVTCDATVNVVSDGPLTVTLLGCPVEPEPDATADAPTPPAQQDMPATGGGMILPGIVVLFALARRRRGRGTGR